MRRITSDQTYSTVTAAICSSLSVVGSVYILGRYWYVRLMKARAVASKHSVSGVRRVDVTQELIHVLAWLDLLGALGRGFGSLPTLTFDQKQGERPTTICKLQAFAISFSDVSAITWNFLMAFNLYRWVCLGEDQQRLQKTIKWYILIALAAAATVTGIALGENVYGDAHVWCWISLPHDRTKEFFWKLWSLYFWIVVLAVAMCVMLTRVNMNVRRRLEGVDNEDARTAYKSVVQTLTIYILAFIGCWVPPLINRVYTYAMGREDFTLLMLHASIVSLQGFVNAVIYGKFHLWIARHTLSHPWYDQPFPKSTKSTDKSQREPPLSARNDGLEIGIASIFVTTFDMNWTKLPANLDQWVPRGKDLYAFTLLHCLGVQDIEQGLREHLLRVNFPTGYRSITSLAGGVVKGNVEGASICQMVFVNNSDVASGNFQFETADGRLWAQRKSNKNVLGIPIRYFDASIAFVACNLRTVSVSSPKQAPPSSILAAKHAATSKLVRSLTMDVDKSGVEFPHLYHHTFLAGDLNYDIAKPHSQLVAAIDQAYRAESLKRSSDSASHKNITAHREPLARLNRASGPCVPSESPRPGEPRMKHQKLEPDDCATEEDYEIVFSKNADGVDYTELRSPRKKSTIVSSTLVDEDISRRSYVGSDGECAIDVTSQDDSRVSLSRSSWREFLDRILPSMTPRSERSYSDGDQNQLGYYDFSTSPEGRKKQIQGWIRRSQFAHGSAQASWTELLQHDELLQAIQAREILSGFEEPPVTFLPTFPRQIGVPATYSMSSTKTCSDLFEDAQVGPPAYADRILTHSLPDARNRIRNVGYWVCEDITTSSHRPVCSIYELEIDRFYAYKNSEASMTDVQAGNVALRDKTNVREFKIKLINLDANIWSYQPTHRQSMNPLRRLRSPSLDTLLYGHDLPQTPEDAAVQTSRRSPERSLGSTSRRSLSSRLLDSRSRSTHRRSLRESMDSPQLELVPIEPSHVVTVFPLPSEDIYALQRKVHEVAHSVQTGFLSSSHSKDAEEASLAFTNSRTVTWKEVTTHGVTHSAIAKPVNGVLHVAISVQGSGKDQGGQGILCINEADLVGIWNQESDDLIPFDIPLTWGGKHVGYLHGDIVRGL